MDAQMWKRVEFLSELFPALTKNLVYPTVHPVSPPFVQYIIDRGWHHATQLTGGLTVSMCHLLNNTYRS
jgi:hypothetical protein